MNGYNMKDDVLSMNIRMEGCPLLDESQIRMLGTGRGCVWADGTATDLSWLPCGSQGVPTLPGTCGDCELRSASMTHETAE